MILIVRVIILISGKDLNQYLQPEGKTFLDIGCSDGFYSIEIAKLKAKHVTGSDLDSLRINRANFIKEVLKIKNVSFEAIDLYNISEKEKYDVSIGLGLLHRVPDLDKCLSKMCQISKTVIIEFKAYQTNLAAYIDHGGISKSNKYNGLYKTPSVLYIKNRLNEFSFNNIKVYDDAESNLNYPRIIVVASKE
jgi:SAM-dependent methyltransferase